MEIDEERNLVLTKYAKRKGEKVVCQSDHNVMWCKKNIPWISYIKRDRTERLNLRDKESQLRFKEISNPKLISCLQNSKDIVSGGRRWIKELQNTVHKCFQKIRCPNRPTVQKEEQIMLEQITFTKREIRVAEKKGMELQTEDLKKVLINQESKLADKIVNKKKEAILKHITDLSDESKNLSNLKVWKLKRKVYPKQLEKPSAKLDKNGKLVTEKTKLKQLYVDTYTERLSHRKVHPGYETLFQLKMNLYELRLESSRQIISSDWSSEEINKVLKSLKTGKSGDHFGLIYELFKPDCISDDLRKSLGILCNEIKNQLLIPKFITFTDITSF